MLLNRLFPRDLFSTSIEIFLAKSLCPNLYASLASVEQLPRDLDAHGVYAGVVDVVRLVKDDDGVFRKVLGD